MASMKDQLGDLPPAWDRYPASPGFTNETTSKAAAARIEPRAGTLRMACLNVYRQDALHGIGGQTADEVAACLGKSILAIRPRITELLKAGWLIETDKTRPNSVSGAAATVLRLAPEKP